jgi:uncharacterized membrane protein
MKRIDSILSITDKLPDDHPLKPRFLALTELDLNDLMTILGQKTKTTSTILGRKTKTTSTSFSGPLPPPQVLAKYMEVSPRFEQLGKSGRDFVLEELERRAQESRTERRFELAGFVTGVLITFSSLVISVALIWLGRPWAGAALGAATLASLAATYALSARNQRNEPPATKPKPKPEDDGNNAAASDD